MGWRGRPRLAARLTAMTDRINVEARRMTLAPAVDALSDLAPQLRFCQALLTFLLGRGGEFESVALLFQTDSGADGGVEGFDDQVGADRRPHHRCPNANRLSAELTDSAHRMAIAAASQHRQCKHRKQQ